MNENKEREALSTAAHGVGGMSECDTFDEWWGKNREALVLDGRPYIIAYKAWCAATAPKKRTCRSTSERAGRVAAHEYPQRPRHA